MFYRKYKIKDIYNNPKRNFLFYIKSDLFSSMKNSFELIKLNDDFINISSYPTNRIYTKCCYDNINNCIWAICKNSKNNIYKLDNLFRENYIIKLNINSKNLSYIQNISFDYKSNSIILVYLNNIISLNPNGELKKNYTYNLKNQIYTSALVYKKHMIISTFSKDNNSYIYCYNNKELTDNINIGNNIYIYNMQIAYYKKNFILCIFIIEHNIYHKIYYIPLSI